MTSPILQLKCRIEFWESTIITMDWRKYVNLVNVKRLSTKKYIHFETAHTAQNAIGLLMMYVRQKLIRKWNTM